MRGRSGSATILKCPLVGTETYKPIACSGLRHGFTLSTTPGITEGVIDNQPFDMELVAEDHLKINDGKVKETASWCHWRKPHRHNYGGVVKLVKTRALQA